MRRATIPCLALVALTAAVASGPASAAGFAANVQIHLERGRYDVDVGNLGQTVMITVETGALKSQQRIAATSYVVHGTATESRLEADFGKLGTISMRFRPSRHRTWVKPHRNCRGLGEFLVRRGVWRGRLRFRGEGGYLSLDLHRARGSVETVAPECRGKDRERRAGERRGGEHRGGKNRGGKNRPRGPGSGATPAAPAPPRSPTGGWSCRPRNPNSAPKCRS